MNDRNGLFAEVCVFRLGDPATSLLIVAGQRDGDDEHRCMHGPSPLLGVSGFALDSHGLTVPLRRLRAKSLGGHRRWQVGCHPLIRSTTRESQVAGQSSLRSQEERADEASPQARRLP